MNQTKLESFIESCLNVGSGFFVALIVWRFVVVPFLGLEVSWHQNLTVTTLFTVVSVCRGYIWRRFFNRGLHRWVHARVKCWTDRRPEPVMPMLRVCGCGFLAPQYGRCERCGGYIR